MEIYGVKNIIAIFISTASEDSFNQAKQSVSPAVPNMADC
jgi:hypothetical protein